MTTAPPRPVAAHLPAVVPDRRLPPGVVWSGALGLSAVLVLALVVGGARPTSGLASAGPLVDWGRPVASLAARIAAVGTVGALLFAAVLHPSPASAAWRRSLRAASGWALAWAAATVVAGWLTLAELVGVGPFSLPASSIGTFLALPAGRAVLGPLTAALVVALVAAFRPSLDAARMMLLVAGAGLLVPVFLAGHSAASENHMLAVNNLAVHVVAASVWVGGLIALLAFARGTDVLAPATARFSTVALWCFGLIGASGVLAAWLVVDEAGGSPAAALASGYGALLIGKTAGLVVLGVLGWQHRRRTLSRLQGGDATAFRRFGVGEVAVMLATVALAVALAASPPPASGAPAAAAPSEGAPSEAAPSEDAEPAADPMAGHDHGELSVTVLIDETRFHVSGPVDAGSRVTLHNASGAEVTITAEDGSFDVDVPPSALMTFAAPAAPGRYAFSSEHDPAYEDVLIVE